MLIKHIFFLTFFLSLFSCISDTKLNTNEMKNQIEKGVNDMFLKSIEPCTKEEMGVLSAADSGNYVVVMEYLKNGGNPMLECENEHSTTIGFYTDILYVDMLFCDSLEYVKYYLDLEITDEVKSEFLHHYLVLENDEMTRYLISIGVHFNDNMYCFPEVLPHFKKSIQLGYDINWQEPETGKNLLMEYAICENEEYITGNLEVIEYLISKGAKTNLKNNKGQTALDMAVNPKIKEYLLSLQ